MTVPRAPLAAFEGVGIELEYMIVDHATLAVAPVADRVLRSAADGAQVNDVARGALGWSNELVLHVIEIKNLQPSSTLDALPAAFQAEVAEINDRLQPLGARLMPGAMHPWMDPRRETRLWPHGNDAIYRAYARIFDTSTHGWANLQSMHVNLPFADDAQFARLHAAIRLVLPILPALAASSPVAEGRITGWADQRLQVYCDNAEGFSSITGQIVPETVTTRAAYEARILAPMYREIAPHDPDHVLQHEWLNSRGAIARFDRNAIEIRVLDTQECPYADMAIAAAAVAAVRALYQAESLVAQQEMSCSALTRILQACARDAEQTLIENAVYLRLLGIDAPVCRAGDVWRQLIARMPERELEHWRPALRTLTEQGPLARRILRAIGADCSAPRLRAVYRALCDCLQNGRMFEASA